MGYEWGIDIRLGSEKFNAEKDGVESGLRAISTAGKGATHGLKRGFDDASRSARGLRREVDSLEQLTARSTKGWESFRRGAAKAIGKSSQSDVDKLTKLTNELTAGIVDTSKSTKGLGKAIKKVGEDGEISLERIIKGQIRMNAANIKAAGSFLLMGSFASRAMGLIQTKVEEGYRKISRLGRAIGGAIASGQGIGDYEGGTALDRMEAILREQKRLSDGGDRTRSQKVASFGASMLGVNTSAIRKEVAATYDIDDALRNIQRKREALNSLAKLGVSMAELEVMESQSLLQIQQRAIDLQDQRNDAIEAGIESMNRLRDDTAAAIKQAREEYRAETDRLKGVVSSIDKQYAAQQRLAALEKDLGNAVRRRVLSHDHAVELMDKQRRLAQDDLHPTMKFLRDLGGQYADAMEKASGAIGRGAVGLRDMARAQADARNKAIIDENNIKNEQSRLKREHDKEQRRLNREHDEFLGRTTAGGGAKAGLRDIRTELQNIGQVTRDSVVDGFHLATDAMVEFFSTGRFEAKSFLKDLARIGIQLGLRGIMSGFAGSPAPGAAHGADFIVPGMASGGSIRARNSSDQVPIFFMASQGERVIVETPQQQQRSTVGQQSAPTVITNTVVPDGRSMLDALRSPAGQREIKNLIVASFPGIARLR